MRKPLLLAHMTAMNHENDRIVLNQPNIESMKPKTELVFMSEEYEDIEELTEEVRLCLKNVSFAVDFISIFCSD